MSKPAGSWWYCPKCAKRFKAHSAYHLKSCEGAKR